MSNHLKEADYCCKCNKPLSEEESHKFLGKMYCREHYEQATGTSKRDQIPGAAHRPKSTKMVIAALIGTILVIVAIIALVSRDSILRDYRQGWMIRSMQDAENLARNLASLNDFIQYGSYGAGAVGLVLLTVGLVGYFQQMSALTIAQTSIDIQSRQKDTASQANIPEQIEQLAKLKTQGILSEDEFEEKKKELLSRL